MLQPMSGGTTNVILGKCYFIIQLLILFKIICMILLVKAKANTGVQVEAGLI